jgi:hypothetical protein
LPLVPRSDHSPRNWGNWWYSTRTECTWCCCRTSCGLPATADARAHLLELGCC